MNPDGNSPDLLTQCYGLRSATARVRELAESLKLLTLACDLAAVECELSAVICEIQKREPSGNVAKIVG